MILKAKYETEEQRNKAMIVIIRIVSPPHLLLGNLIMLNAVLMTFATKKVGNSNRNKNLKTLIDH